MVKTQTYLSFLEGITQELILSPKKKKPNQLVDVINTEKLEGSRERERESNRALFLIQIHTLHRASKRFSCAQLKIHYSLYIGVKSPLIFWPSAKNNSTSTKSLMKGKNMYRIIPA